MNKLVLASRRFLRDEEGVTAIEYGLIAALIAVAIIVAAGLLGGQLDTTFRAICGFLRNGAGGAPC